MTKTIYIIVGGVAVLLILYGIWSAMATAQLQQRLNALRNEGMPITLKDLKKEAPPPDENAAIWLRRGKEDFQAISKEIFNNVDMDKPLSAEDLQKMTAALTTYHVGVDHAHKAANCKVYNAEPDYALPTQTFIEQQLERIQLFRSAARALQCEAMVQLRTGDVKGALQTSLDMVALSNHLAEEPSLIADLTRKALVGMAVARIHDVLAAPLEPADYQRIGQALASLDTNATFKRAIETERAFAIDSINSLHKQSGAIGIPPVMKLQICALLDMLNVAHDATDLSYVEAKKKLGEAAPKSSLARLTFPAIQAAFEAHARVIAMVRTLRILNAIKEQDVTDVKELKVDEALWKDPLDGKRLKVVQADGMWTVYSVGRNLKDDGGEIDLRKDADAGWKMPIEAPK
jgi:hypothetical protein